MTRDWKKAGALILRILIGALFVYASYYKITSPGAFAHQIYNYKILPPFFINPLAIVLPWLQLFCGLGLIFNVWPQACASYIVGMLVVFQSVIASALLRGLNVSCGCFKSGGETATWLTLGRDSIFLLCAIFCLILITKIEKQKRSGLEWN